MTGVKLSQIIAERDFIAHFSALIIFVQTAVTDFLYFLHEKLQTREMHFINVTSLEIVPSEFPFTAVNKSRDLAR